MFSSTCSLLISWLLCCRGNISMGTAWTLSFSLYVTPLSSWLTCSSVIKLWSESSHLQVRSRFETRISSMWHKRNHKCCGFSLLSVISAAAENPAFYRARWAVTPAQNRPRCSLSQETTTVVNTAATHQQQHSAAALFSALPLYITLISAPNAGENLLFDSCGEVASRVVSI